MATTSTGGIISNAMATPDPNAPTTTPAVPNTPNANPAPDYTAQANQLYQSNLGRQGDAAGVKYWADQLASGQSADTVGANFKDASKQVYNDYLTNPASAHAADPNISAILAKDLQTGATPGAYAGNGQDVAKANLNPSIYQNLYGGTPAVNTQPITAPATTPAAAPAPVPSNAPQYTAPSTYTAAQLGAPTKLDVASNQTVAGQLQGLLDPNNPLIQQARTHALQEANAHGLLNSSIAQTGADEAAYAAAIPIATTDAATYNNAAGYNANEGNLFQQANVNSTNAAGQFNAGAANTLTGQKLASDTSLGTANIGANTAITNANTAARTSTSTNAASNAAQLAAAKISAETSAANTKTNADTSIATNAASNATNLATNAASNAAQLAVSKLSTDTQRAVATINNQAQATFQGASSLSALSQNYQNAIQQIGALNMDGTAKTALQQNIFVAYQNATKALDQKLGIPDTSSLLNFTPEGTTATPAATSDAVG